MGGNESEISKQSLVSRDELPVSSEQTDEKRTSRGSEVLFDVKDYFLFLPDFFFAAVRTEEALTTGAAANTGMAEGVA